MLMWLVTCQDKDDVVMRSLSKLFGHRTFSAKAVLRNGVEIHCPPVGTLNMQGRCAQCQRRKMEDG